MLFLHTCDVMQLNLVNSIKVGQKQNHLINRKPLKNRQLQTHQIDSKFDSVAANLGLSPPYTLRYDLDIGTRGVSNRYLGIALSAYSKVIPTSILAGRFSKKQRRAKHGYIITTQKRKHSQNSVLRQVNVHQSKKRSRSHCFPKGNHDWTLASLLKVKLKSVRIML